jgi:hypothetical protein
MFSDISAPDNGDFNDEVVSRIIDYLEEKKVMEGIKNSLRVSVNNPSKTHGLYLTNDSGYIRRLVFSSRGGKWQKYLNHVDFCINAL